MPPTVNGTRVMNHEFSNMGRQLAGGSGIEELMEDLGASGLVSSMVAAWFPAVVGSLLGTLALLYQEDG